jgi:hypothetical protein
MVDRLTVAIAGKRKRVSELRNEILRFRDKISLLTDELQVEEIKLKALEEVAGEEPDDTKSETVENRDEPTPADGPGITKKRGPGGIKGVRLKRGRDKMFDDIATMPHTALALRGLYERFPDGTTTQKLQEFLEREWNRPLKVNSLQVTLSNLKQQGEIDFRNQLWVFLDKGEEKK